MRVDADRADNAELNERVNAKIYADLMGGCVRVDADRADNAELDELLVLKFTLMRDYPEFKGCHRFHRLH